MFAGLEKLFDWIEKAWDRLIPLVIIVQFQNAVVFRFGIYNRTLKPGLHWKIPIVEEVNQQDVTMSTMRLPPQTLTSKDGKSVVAAIAVKYWIEKIEDYVCKCTDQKDVLIDVAMGTLHDAVKERTWDELCAEPPARAILEQIRKEVNEYGFRIKQVKFIERGNIRSLRLVMPHAANLAN